MKKIIYSVSSALLLLSLGACSQDGPASPGSAEEEIDYSYITISLGRNVATKAEVGDLVEENSGLNNGLAVERAIKNVTLYLYDATDNSFLFSGTVAEKSGNATEYYTAEKDADNNTYGGTATFKVTPTQYARLTDLKGHDVRYYVICNLNNADGTSRLVNAAANEAALQDAEIAGDYLNYLNGASRSDGDFVMSGCNVLTIAADPAPAVDPEGDGTEADAEGNESAAEVAAEEVGTLESPWKIFADTKINVTRVCSKLHYDCNVLPPAAVTVNGVSCNYGSIDSTLGFDYKGITYAPNNLNTTGWLFAHYIKNGSASMEALPSFSDTKIYKDADYNLLHSVRPAAALLSDGFFAANLAAGYCFNSISDKFSTSTAAEYFAPFTCESLLGNYNEVPFVIFHMVLKTIPATLQDSWSHALYAYKGVLLGDLSAVENYTNAEGSKIDASEVQMILSEAKTVQDSYASLDAALKAVGEKYGFYQYGYDSAEGGYHVYYFHPIQRRSGKKDKAAHYYLFGMERNVQYNIGINSISAMGYPGDYWPEDIYKEEVDHYFDMYIRVAPWSEVDNHYDLE